MGLTDAVADESGEHTELVLLGDGVDLLETKADLGHDLAVKGAQILADGKEFSVHS